MSANLQDDSERVVMEHYGRSARRRTILRIHEDSYELVIDRCRDRRVLDLGCGSGYGAARVAEVASEVVAIDPSEDAIGHARDRYRKPNLTFERIAPDRQLPFEDHHFDAVLSFQVIEHVDDVNGYLAELMRVLRPGGEAFIVTPDRRNRLFRWQRPWNRWHRREYSRSSLLEQVRRHAPDSHCMVMLADEPWGSRELSRYRRCKWMAIPLTLPLWPERHRLKCLEMLHSLRTKFGTTGRRKPVQKPDTDASHRDTSTSSTLSVRLADDDERSVNLFCIARQAG